VEHVEKVGADGKLSWLEVVVGTRRKRSVAEILEDSEEKCQRCEVRGRNV
jgi:hypothetical protein